MLNRITVQYMINTVQNTLDQQAAIESSLYCTIAERIHTRTLQRCQPGRNFRPGPQIFLFGPARPAINILQNLYNGLNFFFGGGELMKILLSTV